MGLTRFRAVTLFLLALAAVRLPVDLSGIGAAAACAADTTSGRLASAPRITIEPGPTIDLGMVPVDGARDTVVRFRLEDTTSIGYRLVITPSGSRELFLGVRTGDTARLYTDGARIDTLIYRPSDRGADTFNLMVSADGGSNLIGTVRIVGRGGASIVSFDTGGGRLARVDFGTIPATSRRAIWVTILNEGDYPVEPGIAIDQSSAGVFTIDSLSRNGTGLFQPGESMRGRLTFDPRGANGIFTGQIYFRSDSGAGALRLEGRSAAVKRLEVRPDTLTFAPSDTCRTMALKLWNSGTIDLRVDTINLDGGAFSIDPKLLPRVLRPGDTIQIPVVYCPFGNDARHNGTATIYSDADGGISRVFLVGIRSSISWRIDSVTPGPNPPGIVEIPDTAVDSITFHLRSVSSAPLTFAPSRLADGRRGFTLVPNASSVGPDGSTDLVVRFRPNGRLDLLRDTLELIGTRGASMRIPLAGRGLAGRLARVPIPDSVVELDTVRVGEHDTTLVLLQNVGNLPVMLQRSGLAVAGSSGAFQATLTPHATGAVTIPPQGIDTVVVLFNPAVAGADSAVLRISARELLRGFPLREADLLLGLRGVGVGTGTREPLEGKGWLTGGVVPLGEAIDLPLMVSPGLAPSDSVTAFSVRMALRSGALNPVEARSPHGPLKITREAGGIFTVDGDGLWPVTGDRLFTLSVMPLSAAHGTETISVLSIRLGQAGLGDVWLDTAGSVATLSVLGCGVGAAPPFSRRTLIRGVSVAPGAAEAIVEYGAPDGALSTIRVIDLAGVERLCRMLPDGTGELRSARLGLGALPPGIYLLELRTGSDRSAVPIFLVR